ncbi:hypothetical protein EZV61_03440 [Corallincola luteus]|uniref:Uncharacterized protein n=1 Tax=Corallincola luteus TaxID=1775177 RepID=A0ABY2AS41_9GAMM|nr:hypothetical protein [Corallincola luteus]TCI05031.1 hypothetical protein EZV61_03440 [Corallincola luteus]
MEELRYQALELIDDATFVSDIAVVIRELRAFEEMDRISSGRMSKDINRLFEAFDNMLPASINNCIELSPDFGDAFAKLRECAAEDISFGQREFNRGIKRRYIDKARLLCRRYGIKTKKTEGSTYHLVLAMLLTYSGSDLSIEQANRRAWTWLRD